MRRRLPVSAALILLALSSKIVAAPIPPDAGKPPALTAERIVGTWQYEFGCYTGGWIQFDRDGTYISQHEPGTTVYAGSWRIADGAVMLTEHRFNFGLPCTTTPTEYRYPFDMRAYPTLTCSCGGTRVRIAKVK